RRPERELCCFQGILCGLLRDSQRTALLGQVCQRFRSPPGVPNDPEHLKTLLVPVLCLPIFSHQSSRCAHMAQGRSHPPEIPDVLAEPITFLCQRLRLDSVAQHRCHLTEKAKAKCGESSIPKRLRTHQRFLDERRGFLRLS